MQDTLQQFRRYLKETLDVTVSPKAWEGVDGLPFYLRDFYSFFWVNILETPCLLLLDRGETAQTPANVRKHLKQVQERWQGEVIYVRQTVNAYNRKRLIEQRAPFVVPGNQMYLPTLGIDLREHFRNLRVSGNHRLSPSTQAVLLHALLNRTGQMLTLSELAIRLGYKAMTITRAFNELEAFGLGEAPTGRERRLFFKDSPKALWEKAHEFMRSPVRKRIWIHRGYVNQPPGPQAGLTALAHYSMLAAPDQPVYAVRAWNALQQREVPAGDPEAFELEIWSYAPDLFAKADVVDPLSLYLSLRENADERVQAALAKMMEKISW